MCTLLFFFPAVVTEAGDIIILNRPLQVLQGRPGELLGELLPHVIGHLQVLRQPLLCVTR